MKHPKVRYEQHRFMPVGFAGYNHQLQPPVPAMSMYWITFRHNGVRMTTDTRLYIYSSNDDRWYPY